MQELIVKQVRRTSSKFSSLNHSSEGSVGCAELLKLNSFMLLAFFYMFNCLSSLAYSDFSWGREIYGGAGGTWVNFCRVCESLPHYSLFLVPFGQICNFRDPNLVTFYFFLRIDPFLDWMKSTLFFIYRNILVRLLTVNTKNCLTRKNPKMCDPILVTLLKISKGWVWSSGWP